VDGSRRGIGIPIAYLGKEYKSAGDWAALSSSIRQSSVRSALSSVTLSPPTGTLSLTEPIAKTIAQQLTFFCRRRGFYTLTHWGSLPETPLSLKLVGACMSE